MKHVVFVLRDQCVGGFTSALSSLYDAIKDDYEVTVIQLTKMGNAIISYDDVVIKPWWLCDFYYSDFTLAYGLRKLGIGIVHAYAKFDKNIEKRISKHYTKILSNADCVIAYGEGFASRFVQYINHPNKVAWLHYDVSHYPKSSEDELLYQRFNAVVCVADTIAKGMRKMYPTIEKKIFGIHNILDEHRIELLSRDVVQEHFDAPINIISLGRFASVKRFPMIPRIAASLRDKGLKFKWWILGPASDEVESSKLKQEIAQYNVDDCVEWIGNRTNPYPYIALSDVLVSTSITEACPMIFTEARILKKPIVSADFLTASEFIENGVDGCITPLEMMADCIYNLFSEHSKLESIKRASSERGSGNEETLNRFCNLVNCTNV